MVLDNLNTEHKLSVPCAWKNVLQVKPLSPNIIIIDLKK